MSQALNYSAVVFMIVALMLLGADVIAVLETRGEATLNSLATVWRLLHQQSADSFEGWMQASSPAPIFTAVNAVLSTPAWFVPSLLGITIGYLARRRDAVA